MPTDSSDLPKLTLQYAFQPPIGPNVIVSTDSRYQVTSPDLVLSIRNPADHPVVNFKNPDGLNPDSDLPPITAPEDWPKPLDRLYLRFPWCDQPAASCQGYLTTVDKSTGVLCSADEGNTQWYTRPMSDSKLGRYWILFPKDKSVHLEANQSVNFKISGIVTYIPAMTLTSCYIKPAVKGYASTDEPVAQLNLIDPPPAISLAASDTDIVAGTKIKLTWETINAKSCQLSPIGGGVKDVSTQEPNGFPVKPLQSTNFTLEATSPIGKTNRQSVQVNVKPVVINSFKAEPPTSRMGEAVKLSWETVSAVSCSIAPTVGSVCEQAKGCASGSRSVNPAQYTEYTLTAVGEGGPKTKQVAVFPVKSGWNTYTTAAPWTTTGRPVLLKFTPQGGRIEQLWFLAGGAGAPGWVFQSKDAANWQPVTNNAAYGSRGHSAGVVFQNKMWLVGGATASGAVNSIWTSSDGIHWTEAVEKAPWSARTDLGCIVFQDKMWVLGGKDASGNALNDIWNSVDGLKWKQVEDHASWSSRSAFGLASFNNVLWLMAGDVNGTAVADLWSSPDGAIWNQSRPPPWQPRSSPNVQVLGDQLYLVAGTDGQGKGLHDQHTMNASGQWSVSPGPPWGADIVATASVTYQNAIWFAGGRRLASNLTFPNLTVSGYAP